MAKPIPLIDTTGMDEKRWLECRMHGPDGNIKYTVGGSDVAAIFGVSPWTSPLELWLIKKGKMKPAIKDNADQLLMGHMLEPIAAAWFARKKGYQVNDDKIMYQHADFPYCLANYDRRFIRPDGVKGILECKSTTYHKASDWEDDAIPLHYDFQGRYYLGVDDTDEGAFSCLWGNNPETDIAMPLFSRDKVKEDIIFEKIEQWIWSLEHDKPPTMEGVKPSVALVSLARIYGRSIRGLPTIEFPSKYEHPIRRIATLQTEIAEHEGEIKKREKEMEAHSARIAELMKEHEKGILETTSDKLLIDYVTRTSKRPDSKKLKDKYPDVYEDVLKISESRKIKVAIQPITAAKVV